MKVNKVYIGKIDGSSFQFKSNYKNDLSVNFDNEIFEVISINKQSKEINKLFISKTKFIEKLKIFIN